MHVPPPASPMLLSVCTLSMATVAIGEADTYAAFSPLITHESPSSRARTVPRNFGSV
jgi:hypothetical protein